MKKGDGGLKPLCGMDCINPYHLRGDLETPPLLSVQAKANLFDLPVRKCKKIQNIIPATTCQDMEIVGADVVISYFPEEGYCPLPLMKVRDRFVVGCACK